ncbi:hypothetical protein GGR51DRAFT_555161 [Nemania sp. FL0031]|nr:hypothetical protein GGR51DRAFT_555161 [Nemania sp. FL0031]
MSHATQDQRQEAEESIDAFIESYFDLETASQPSESELADQELTQSSGRDYLIDANIPGFKPITGWMEDPHITQLIDALEYKHDSGGWGPFVFPHSPNVFMGSDDRAAEQLPGETKAKPLIARMPKKIPKPLDFSNPPNNPRLRQILPSISPILALELSY